MCLTGACGAGTASTYWSAAEEPELGVVVVGVVVAAGVVAAVVVVEAAVPLAAGA